VRRAEWRSWQRVGLISQRTQDRSLSPLHTLFFASRLPFFLTKTGRFSQVGGIATDVPQTFSAVSSAPCVYICVKLCQYILNIANYVIDILKYIKYIDPHESFFEDWLIAILEIPLN
jgi:hypothetical protein